MLIKKHRTYLTLRALVHMPETPRSHLINLGLSSREAEVAEFMARGMTIREIAENLNITKSSAATYCKRLYSKLGVTCAEEAAAKLSQMMPRQRLLVDEDEYCCARLILPIGVRNMSLGCALGAISALAATNLEEYLVYQSVVSGPLATGVLMIMAFVAWVSFSLLLDGHQTPWRNEAAYSTLCLIVFVLSALSNNPNGIGFWTFLAARGKSSAILSSVMLMLLLMMGGVLVSTAENIEKAEFCKLSVSALLTGLAVVPAVSRGSAYAVPAISLVTFLLGLAYLRSADLSLPRMAYRRARSLSIKSCWPIACIGMTAMYGIKLLPFALKGQALMAAGVELYLFGLLRGQRGALAWFYKPIVCIMAEAVFVFVFGMTFGDFIAQIMQPVGFELELILMLISAISMVCLARSVMGTFRFSQLTRAQRALVVLGDEGIKLSPAEIGIYIRLLRSRDSASICKELYISRHTFNSHCAHIYNKINVHSAKELRSKTNALLRESKRVQI